MLWTKWTCYLCLTLSGSVPSFSCPRGFAAENGHLEQPSEVPFELYNENLIVVKGAIGPVKNVNILLDTGTNPTAISTEIAGQLNLRGSTEPLLSSTGQIDVQSVILPGIDIGALHGRSIRVVVQDLSFMQRGLGISIGAVAGLDVLSTGSFMIDYCSRKIVFAPGRAGRKSVRFETERPFLTVKVKIAGQELRLLVDSGTPGLLLFRKRFKAILANLEPLPNDRNTVIFTATGTMHAAWYRASQVSLGTESIESQMVLVADGDPDPRYEFDGLLGFAKTGFQKVWLDFENGLFGWELARDLVVVNGTEGQKRLLACIVKASADDLRLVPNPDEPMTVVILEHRKFLQARGAFHAYRTVLAFSHLAIKRIYLSSRVFADRNTALWVIGHELGHFVIQDGIEGHAEFAAERIRWRARQTCSSGLR